MCDLFDLCAFEARRHCHTEIINHNLSIFFHPTIIIQHTAQYGGYYANCNGCIRNGTFLFHSKRINHQTIARYIKYSKQITSSGLLFINGILKYYFSAISFYIHRYTGSNVVKRRGEKTDSHTDWWFSAMQIFVICDECAMSKRTHCWCWQFNFDNCLPLQICIWKLHTEAIRKLPYK